MSIIGNSIKESIKFLEDGGLVGIPTETVYGLAANGLDANAVLKIFKKKLLKIIFCGFRNEKNCLIKVDRFGSRHLINFYLNNFWT